MTFSAFVRIGAIVYEKLSREIKYIHGVNISIIMISIIIIVIIIIIKIIIKIF